MLAELEMDSKKDLIAWLIELFSTCDPRFQAIFQAEFPKLNWEEQLQFHELLHRDLDETILRLKNSQTSALAA